MSATLRCMPMAPGLALCLLALSVSAQTLDGKAPASGKVMTQNELRVCIKQQDELSARRQELELQRTQLDKDREAVLAETEAVKADRAALELRQVPIRAYNERMQAFATKVSDLKKRYQELTDSGATGRSLEKGTAALEKERLALVAEEAENKAEAARLGEGLDTMVEKLNARAEAQGKLATDWNTRNRAFEAANTAYEDTRLDWRSQCGNRRYKEDDEKLIRAERKK
jgi:hypothetical protein